MKFLRLDLLAYGLFTNRTLDFSAKGPGFYLLTGLNEAGKTTVLQSLSDLLFGFQKSSNYGFKHGLPALTLGARIENSSGQGLEFMRHKRNKDPLVGVNKAPMAESVLDAFFAGADKSLFEKLFALSHERLRQGGAAILASNGEVGSALFEAGSGVRGAQAVLSQLEQEYQDLYIPRGTRKLNKARTAWSAARKEIQTLSLSADEWQDLASQQLELQARQDELFQTQGVRQRELARLERIRRVRPSLVRRDHLLEKLVGLGELPELSPTRLSERGALVAESGKIEGKLIHCNDLVLQFEREMEPLRVVPEVLAQGREIESLYKESGEFRKSLKDLPRRKAELNGVETKMSELQRDAGLTLALSEGLPTEPLVANLRVLIRQQGEIDARLVQAVEMADQLAVEIACCVKELELNPVPPDFQPLARLLDEARECGLNENQLQEMASKVTGLTDEVAKGLWELPLWSGDVEALRCAVVPSAEQVERMIETLGGINGELVLVGKRVVEEKRGLADVERQLVAMQAEGDVPTPEAVVGARARRDLGWSLVRGFYVEGLQDQEEAIAAFVAGRSLADVFESSMTTADHLVDQRLAQATWSADYNALSVELLKYRDRVAEVVAREQELIQQRDLCQRDWLALWSQSGVQPADPAGMRGWPERRLAVLARFAELEQAKQRSVTVTQEYTVWCQRLESLLSEEGVSRQAREGIASLSAWIQLGMDLLKQRQAQSRQREGLVEKLNGSQKREAEAKRRVARATEELVSWRALWQHDVTRLGCDVNASLVVVETALGMLEDIRRLSDQQKSLLGRIRDIEVDYARFAQDVGRVAEVAGEVDVQEVAPIELIEALHDRWLKSAEADRHQASLLKKIAAQKNEGLTLLRLQEENQRNLEKLRQLYGVESLDEMEAVESRLVQKTELSVEVERLEKEILSAGGDKSLDELLAEAKGEDGESLLGRVEQLNDEINRLINERTVVANQLGEVKVKLAQMSGGDQAASAAQDEAVALAQMERGVDHYVVTRLAACLIEKAVVRFQERHQNPVLLRASGLFNRLTLGSFMALDVDLNEKGVYALRAVRPDGKQLEVENLSDGTRDQLYLSLHLAMLAQRSDFAEPLPLVLDDLLIHFDDRRSAATFQVLAELSRSVQILFFTHHAHLVDVAKQSVAASEITFLEL